MGRIERFYDSLDIEPKDYTPLIGQFYYMDRIITNRRTDVSGYIKQIATSTALTSINMVTGLASILMVLEGIENNFFN